MATTAPAQPNPRQPGGKQSRRVFRSISRFLSGGGTKQRPKLAHQPDSDGPPPASNHDERQRTPSRSRSRSSSRSSSPRRGGAAGHPDDEEHHLSPAGGERRHSASNSGRSVVSGADTDASIYPISPSTRPPSSIMSKQTAHTLDSASIASFAPTHGGSTYAKSYASTKPTTLLSIDSGGGANRIAVVPGTGTGGHFGGQGAGGHLHQSTASQHPGMTTSVSGNSLVAPVSPLAASSPGITFSSLPAFSPTSSSPYALHPSLQNHRASTSSSSSSLLSGPPGQRYNPDSPSSHGHDNDDEPDLDGIGIPAYTHAHPRNNPHPSQIPPDNASVLTLASSSFAPSLIGSGAASTTRDGARSSWGGGGIGGLKAWSTKQARSFGGGGGKGGNPAGADEDASVRALAGSRRPSEESLGAKSTWSAVVGGASGGGKEFAPSVLSGIEGRKERQGSILSRDLMATEQQAEDDDEHEQTPAEAVVEKEGRRRSSLRTFATGDDLEAAAESPVVDETAKEEETTEQAEDAPLPPSSVEKGKGVDAAEHAGLAAAQPLLAAAAFSPPAPSSDLASKAAGLAGLPPPVAELTAAAVNEGGETPRWERKEEEALSSTA